MREANNLDQHVTEVTWWQWRDDELALHEVQALRAHLNVCASCRQQAVRLERLFTTLRQAHHTVQPTLAEQMQLAQVLEQKFVLEELPRILIESSRRLLRWLTPALAILVVVFIILLRQDENVATNALANLLPETPESQLLLVNSDEQFQQTMWEVALRLEENQP